MTTTNEITREEFDALIARVVKLEKIVFANAQSPQPTRMAENQLAEAEQVFGTHTIDGRKSRFL